MATKTEFTSLAETIMFSGVTITNGGSPYGFFYRKGKTISDLQEAVKRGMKNGHGKVEFEISAIAVQLEKVLKLNPKEQHDA